MNSPKLTENFNSALTSSSPAADSKFFDGDSLSSPSSVFRKAISFTKATTSSIITTTSSAVNAVSNVVDSSVETLSSSPLPSSPPTSPNANSTSGNSGGGFEVSSILPTSFGATASSVLNKINPFDFANNTNSNSESSSNNNQQQQANSNSSFEEANGEIKGNSNARSNQQKEKQNLFSSKFNFASLSISTGPIFNLLDAEEGKARHLHRTKSNKYENRTHASNMLTMNNSRRTNSESGNNTNNASANTTASGNTSLNASANSSILSPSGSMKRHKLKPAGTLDYQVLNNDTIEKIALKWNSTPTNILHLNSMATRTIFPGQTLYVPDPDYVPPPVTTPPSTPLSSNAPTPLTVINEVNASEKHDSSESLFSSQSNVSSNSFNFFKWRTGSTSAKPGHVELQQTPESINSKHGHHHHHHHHHHHPQAHHSNSLPASEEHKHQMLTSRHTLSEEEAKQLDEECMQRFLKINCKIVTRSKGCYDGVLIITPSALMFDPVDVNANENSSSNDEGAKEAADTASASKVRRNSNVTSNIYDEASAIIPIELISNVIMYEDLALKDVQEYFDFQQNQSLVDFDETTGQGESTTTFHISADSTSTQTKLEQSETEPVGECRQSSSSVVRNAETHEPVKQSDEEELKKSLLTDAMADLSMSSNTGSENTTSTPKTSDTASKSADAAISCYLCIKVNTTRDFLTCPFDRRMKNKLKSEFWFQVYDNSRYKTTDKICAFFLEWKNDSFHEQTSSKGHFQLVKQDEKLTDLIAENLLGPTKGLNKSFSSTNRLLNRGNTFVKDWEIVNLQEFELKLKQELEIEKEYKTLPTLMDPSTILKDEHLRKLNVNLIPRAMGYNWVLSFSTEKHGFSLNTIYRNLTDVESPCLVVVMDTNLNIFGAMLSGKLVPSEHFYGTGESFLYTFYPSFKVFKWTGENNFFTKGNSEGIYFGAGEGLHGLWFDGDLLNGHTQKSKTFDNELLSSTEFFQIKSLEVWTFSDE